MGYYQHDAIIVTTWQERASLKVRRKAKALGLHVTTAIKSGMNGVFMNGFKSVLVGPDGSKEGSEYSDAGDRARKLFDEWLVEVRNRKKNPIFVAWVHVSFGDAGARIVKTSEKKRI